MQRKLIQVVAVSVAFSLMGMVLVFWYGGLRPAQLTRLREINPLALLAALAALALSMVLAAFRLQLLCRRLGLSLTLKHALRTHILGIFSAAATPGGSGSAPAIAFNLNYHGLTAAEAWASAIALFVADALFLTWSLPVSLLYLRSQGLYSRDPVWTLLGVVSIMVTGLLAVLLTYRLRWTEHLVRTVCRGPLLRFRKNLLRFSQSLLESSTTFKSAGPGYHGLVQLWTAASWFAHFLVLVFAAWGFGLNLPLLAAQAWQVVVTALSVVVPSPGGSGFFEFGTSLLLLEQGNTEAVPAALLVYRLLTYYLFFIVGPLLGGYMLLTHLEAADKSKA